MAEVRYCPLCDRERTEAWCPIHHVPTLPPIEDKPPKLVNGSVVVDRYRVEGVLSHGGMGTVLDAVQMGMNRAVVIKVLKGTRAEDRARMRRFYQEALLVSGLDHPNIVRIFEFGVDPVHQVPFIAMEKIEGVTLQRLVDRDGPLEERRAARLFSQIIRALAEAHGKGVLHRDLKPRNIMVRRLPEGDEHVTVLDFGLAKLIEETSDMPPLTAPGRTVGTPGFMSPEQVLGRKLDPRSDLYGVGCMLFAALAGHPPFDGPAALNVMRKQVREEPPPLPRKLSDGNPPTPALTRLLFSLLEKHPDDRPRRIEDVRDVLDRLAAGTVTIIDDEETLPAGRIREAVQRHREQAELDEDFETIRLSSSPVMRRQLSEDEDGLATESTPPRNASLRWAMVAAVLAVAAAAVYLVS
ncbi:MAG: serine/threonine-protein kinase [Myxococcota bacterium]